MGFSKLEYWSGLPFPHVHTYIRTSQVTQVLKNPPANAGDTGDAGLIPESGRFPGGGNSYPLQYSCLKNPVHRGPWRAAVHGVAESDTTEHA